MKKFILRLSLFALFFAFYFVFINLLFIWVISSTDWDVIKRIESLKLDNPDYDLVVLGASAAMDDVDTKMLTENNLKSYNMALDGSTVRTSYIQLKEYLEKCSKMPRYVVLGVNSLNETFSNNGIQPIVDVTMKDHTFTLKDIPILRFKWLGFEFLKKIVSKNHRKAGLVDGQLKFQKTIPDRSSYINSNLDLSEFETSVWMGEIAKLCTQNQIDLVVLELPGYKELQNRSGIGPYKVNFTNGYSAHLYNFGFKDFCMIFDKDKDWVGNSHLNQFGASKFTKELFNHLQKLESNYTIKAEI